MQAEVEFGHSGVIATPLGLGANAVGGYNLFPQLNDEQGLSVVRAALDHGIRLIDTAYVYGLGHSETLIGEAIQDYDRYSFALASKGAHDYSTGDRVINNHPDFLTQQVENSLQRLGTDYLDIFYIHYPDQDTPKAEAVGALQRLKEAGKIRAIGLSNFSLAQVKEANADGYVDVVEDEFSLLHQQNARDLMPYLKEQGISFVPYFPLASGLLTGKYDQATSFPADDIRSTMADFREPRFGKIRGALAVVRTIAASHGATVSQVVLAWYMQNPLITAVIPGAKQPDQVIQNAAALQLELTPSEYQTFEEAFAGFK